MRLISAKTCENQFYLHEDKTIIFISMSLHLSKCFQTEANLRGNSEMTYSLNLLCREAFYGTQVAFERALCLGKVQKDHQERERGRTCRQTFGTTIPQHLLCIKLLLARTLSVDRFNKHCFGRHVACNLNNHL